MMISGEERENEREEKGFFLEAFRVLSVQLKKLSNFFQKLSVPNFFLFFAL